MITKTYKQVYYKFKLDKQYMETTWTSKQKELELTFNDIFWVEFCHYGVGFSTLKMLKESSECKLLKEYDIPFKIIKQSQYTLLMERTVVNEKH